MKGSAIVRQLEMHRIVTEKAATGQASRLGWMLSEATNNVFLKEAETRHVLVEKDFTKRKNAET